MNLSWRDEDDSAADDSSEVSAGELYGCRQDLLLFIAQSAHSQGGSSEGIFTSLRHNLNELCRRESDPTRDGVLANG